MHFRIQHPTGFPDTSSKVFRNVFCNTAWDNDPALATIHEVSPTCHVLLNFNRKSMNICICHLFMVQNNRGHVSIGVRQLIASNSWIKNQTRPRKQGMKARFNWDSMSYLPIHIRYHSFKKDQKGRLLMIREKLWTTSCPSKPKEKLKKNINVPKRASPWCRGRLRLPDSTIAQKKNTQKPGASNVTHNLQPFILCNLHTKELKQSKIHLKKRSV